MTASYLFAVTNWRDAKRAHVTLLNAWTRQLFDRADCGFAWILVQAASWNDALYV